MKNFNVCDEGGKMELSVWCMHTVIEVVRVFWKLDPCCQIPFRFAYICSIATYKLNYFRISPEFYIFPRANGTNSPRLFTPGETKALAKSKVHQWSRAWVTNVGGHPHWSQNIADCHESSEHWLVQVIKICFITTAWRQRNSKHFFIWFEIYFIFARFCKFQKLFDKILNKVTIWPAAGHGLYGRQYSDYS
jgi:hypothetical protein